MARCGIGIGSVVPRRQDVAEFVVFDSIATELIRGEVSIGTEPITVPGIGHSPGKPQSTRFVRSQVETNLSPALVLVQRTSIAITADTTGRSVSHLPATPHITLGRLSTYDASIRN